MGLKSLESMTSLSNLELINLIKTSSDRQREKAMALIYKKSKRPLFAFLFRLTGDKMFSEDLMQESFIKLFQHIDKQEFEGEKNFFNYIKTIGRNSFINFMRQNSKNSVDYIGDFYDTTLKNISHSHASPEEELLKREEYRILSEEIENLKKESIKLYTPLYLYYFEGKKYREIAESLNVSMASVKANIYYAKRKIKQRILSAR